jgi:hypothetical protein
MKPGRRARDDASKRARLLMLTFASLCVTGAMMTGPSADTSAETTAGGAEEPDTIALQSLLATACEPGTDQHWVAANPGLMPVNEDNGGPICYCNGSEAPLSAHLTTAVPGGTLIVVRD